MVLQREPDGSIQSFLGVTFDLLTLSEFFINALNVKNIQFKELLPLANNLQVVSENLMCQKPKFQIFEEMNIPCIVCESQNLGIVYANKKMKEILSDVFTRKCLVNILRCDSWNPLQDFLTKKLHSLEIEGYFDKTQKIYRLIGHWIGSNFIVFQIYSHQKTFRQ